MVCLHLYGWDELLSVQTESRKCQSDGRTESDSTITKNALTIR